jgi:hypothetical protein
LVEKSTDVGIQKLAKVLVGQESGEELISELIDGIVNDLNEDVDAWQTLIDKQTTGYIDELFDDFELPVGVGTEGLKTKLTQKLTQVVYENQNQLVEKLRIQLEDTGQPVVDALNRYSEKLIASIDDINVTAKKLIQPMNDAIANCKRKSSKQLRRLKKTN